MNHHRSYSSFTGISPPTRHSAASHHTSSAFSPCANANEDWTKISDLAERRRIQNRIAQRNYRKKLKKRLEDLERRAASSSASPEQKHEELPYSGTLASIPALSKRASASATAALKRSNRAGQRQVTADDRGGMFSQQHMRQLSASPPPFSYQPYSSSTLTQPTYSQPYLSPPYVSSDLQSYTTQMPALTQSYTPSTTWATKVPQVKQECFAEDEMSPFGMSYASMAGMDVSYATSNGGYAEQPMMHTPDPSDTYEHSSEGSPGDFASSFSMTPIVMPMTPPLQAYEK